jgi:hypothetical protein
MRYLKSYAIFENSTGSEDAEILMDAYKNTEAGKDLEWINIFGYGISSGGEFYIGEKSFEYIIKRTVNDKWEIFHTRKKQILGEFDTPEDVFRYIWAIIVVREEGIPVGISRKDYMELLLSPKCPAWGQRKGSIYSPSWIKRMCEEYISGTSQNTASSFDGIFSGKNWDWKFKIIGSEPNVNMSTYISFFPKNEKILNHEGGKEISIPGFTAHFSPVKTLKSKYDKYTKQLDITIGGSSIAEIEKGIIDRYIRDLNSAVIGEYGPGEHPSLKIIKAVLNENPSQNEIDLISKILADIASKNPAIFAGLPDRLRKEVAKIAEYQDDEVEGIIKAVEYGLY